MKDVIAISQVRDDNSLNQDGKRGGNKSACILDIFWSQIQ